MIQKLRIDMPNISMNGLSHEQKDDLLRLTKKALELACMRLAAYEGSASPTANPEQWIARTNLITKTSGWKFKK